MQTTQDDRHRTIKTDENGNTYFVVKSGRGAVTHLSHFTITERGIRMGNTISCRQSYNSRSSSIYIPATSSPLDVTCEKCLAKHGA